MVRAYVVLVLVGLLNAYSVWANEIDSSGYGGQIRPMSSKDIRIVREDLSFVHRRDSTGVAKVDVSDNYVINNAGPSRSVGFDMLFPTSSAPVSSITIVVNGKAVKLASTSQKDQGGKVYHFTARLVKGRNTIDRRYEKEVSGTTLHDQVIGYQLAEVIDTFNVLVDVGMIGDQRLLMVPTALSGSPAPLPWSIPTTATIIDTICVRDLWPDRSVTRGAPNCPGEEVSVMICPDGKIRYTEIGFRPTRHLLILVANEMWLRTKAMRSAVPPPLPGQLHGMPR